ncbi:hypothetical protein QUF86_20095 [Peribacillus sp. NJ11]|uniref:hypothetical protein n=1 Tax=Peribacillus sp. NJ11 TaxID=3055861 RepID=UPI0025A12C93|nr:hypothetical protein [Peribacillus sp. NJ11]MDM5222998.1 hypothetical protein [Peribacillus sp. NJ11]
MSNVKVSICKEKEVNKESKLEVTLGGKKSIREITTQAIECYQEGKSFFIYVSREQLEQERYTDY